MAVHDNTQQVAPPVAAPILENDDMDFGGVDEDDNNILIDQ